MQNRREKTAEFEKNMDPGNRIRRGLRSDCRVGLRFHG